MDEPNVTPIAPPRPRLSPGRLVSSGLTVYLIVLALLLIGGLTSPEFRSLENLLNVVRPITLLGIVTVGGAFVATSGHYVDLSLPNIMALSGTVSIGCLPAGLGISLAAGMAAGLLMGLINGIAIGTLRLHPILWTLAVAFALDGALRWAFSGNQVYPDAASGPGAAFVALSRMEGFAGAPAMTWLLILLAILGHGLMKRTRFGAHVRMTGAAYEVARASGIHVRRIVLFTFLLSSFTTSVAGILLASLSKLGTFQNGQGYEFNSVTAVVLGGVSLAGGQGSIPGAMGGVLVMGLLGNIMTLWGMDSFSQLIVKGVVFILCVGTGALLSRRAGRDDG